MENKGPGWFTILTWLGVICSVSLMFYFLSILNKLPTSITMTPEGYHQHLNYYAAKSVVIRAIFLMAAGLFIIAWNILKE